MKEKINYFIDVLMLIFFIIVAFSGIFLLITDVGFRGTFSILGIKRCVFKEIHEYFGIVFIILMAAHIALHMKWILCMSKKMLKKSR